MEPDRTKVEETPLRSQYKNNRHYIDEGWHTEPKRLFVRIADVIEASGTGTAASVLDIGCATGELLGYLHYRFPTFDLTGIEISAAAAAEARRLASFATILEGSALAATKAVDRRFDIVIGCGIMGVFDFAELTRYVDELAGVVRPGGRIYLAEPYNPYGMDLVAHHRKRTNGTSGDWERGNSIFSRETVEELFGTRAKGFLLHAFDVDVDLHRQADPQRTWTVPFAGKKRQLVNGLNLLMDIGILEARF